jgi:hypothetical protein
VHTWPTVNTAVNDFNNVFGNNHNGMLLGTSACAVHFVHILRSLPHHPGLSSSMVLTWHD